VATPGRNDAEFGKYGQNSAERAVIQQMLAGKGPAFPSVKGISEMSKQSKMSLRHKGPIYLPEP